MEFIEKTLGQIESLIKTGKTPPSKVREYYEGNINWYTPGDLDKSKFLGKSTRTITQEAVKKGKATLFPKNSVLIGCIGDIGKIGITAEEASSNQQITAIQTNEEVHYEYLFYYLKANKHLLQKLSKNALLSILNNSNLRRLKISYPISLDNQKRIAQVLSNCESLIKKRKESIALLDELLKSTFLEMFGDPVRNEKGWNVVSLSKFGTTDRGVSKHRPRNEPKLLGGKHPLIQTGDVSNSGTYITNYTQTYSDIGLAQSKKWPIGTLCITIAANIAKTGILKFEACFPDSIVGFVVDDKEATNLYVHHLFSFFQRILEKNAPSAAQKNINLGILRNFKVPQPPIDLQFKFDEIVLKVESIKQNYESNLQELENLYGSISQKAFKGELDLSKVVLVEDKLLPSDKVENTEVSSKKDEEDLSFKGDKDNLSPKEETEKTEDEILDEIETKNREIWLKDKEKENFIDLMEEELECLIESYNHSLPKGKLKKNRTTDITNLSIREYLGFSKEVQEENEGIEFSHLDKDFFYQFILKDGFSDKNFIAQELESYARKYILRGSGFEFTHEHWKTIIYRFLETQPPFLEQIFDENDNTIKLKLTDEAFKA